jgi:hypothetical protein
VDGDESDDDELPLLKAPPTSAVEAPTTSEGAYAKLGRLNGHENNRILSQFQWQGGVRAVDDNKHVGRERVCGSPYKFWWASACQVPDLRKCLCAKVPVLSERIFPEAAA